MATKKEIERWHLDRFVSLRGHPFTGEITPTEEPDFLGTTDSQRTLGIELTELHREHNGAGRPLQELQAMRERVVLRAKEIYDSAGHPPARITVFLNDHHALAKGRVEALARTIVDIAVQNLPAIDESNWQDAGWSEDDDFPEEVTTISVHRLAEMTESFFNAPGGTWMVDLQPDDIQRVLDEKEPKLPAYRRKCQEAWLVIVSIHRSCPPGSK